MGRPTPNAAVLEARAFAVPRRVAVRPLIAAAVGKLSVSMPVGQRAHLRYLDTFDRRLRRAGVVLEHLTLPGATTLQYRVLARATTLIEAPGASLPAFAHEIAHVRLRSLLFAVSDIRRLLVVAEARGRLAVARGLDREDKTVLVVECFAAPRDPIRLTVRPLRGYERFARRAIRRLRKADGVVPDDREPMLEASDGPDARFGGTAIPVRMDLDPDERSDVACRRLLAALDAVLEMNTHGVEADLDPECLHDFRVATRKARSLLREMKRVFPPSVTRRLRANFGWIGQFTGPVRDLDVHLMDLGPVTAGDGDEGAGDGTVEAAGVTVAEAAGEVPGEGAGEAAVRGTAKGTVTGTDHGADSATAALRDHLQALRTREFQALCRTLRSARFRGVRTALRRFLASEPPARPRSDNASMPIGSLSAKCIRGVYRRILREGRAIGDDSPPEALHDLRKTCKRLRYLLEFFRGLHPAKPVERTISRLKRLQDNLGAYQDAQVQQAVLLEFRDRAGATLDPAGASAIDTQRAALAERERRIRAEFSARFATYDSKRAHREFERALGRRRK